MDASSSLEVGPTEDVFQALLDYLVDPLLPLKSSVKEAPSLSLQELVAKQMHAVVLLYNYYQRKCHPVVELLGFESCCKLAVILKPTLMAHMKLMHRSDYTEVDDLENQLSLTEKAIMDACDISTSLDATKDVPGTEGWPISKVTVLLVDSMKENCLLLFSSITNGIWSVIEKDLDASNIDSGSNVNHKAKKQRKKISRKFPRDKVRADEASLQQLAFSAVKEVEGINQSDLMVLESHVVYSLSKEKTTARFYIVQCTQSISEELRVPVKDTIESLQGSLVKKSSCGWRVTPVVEYFHVLPYAGILSDWLSRELSSKRVKMENVDMDSSNRTENPRNEEVTKDKEICIQSHGVTDAINNEAFSGNGESPKQNDNKGCQMTFLTNSVDGPDRMDVENSSSVCTQNEDKIKNTCDAVKGYNHQKKITNSMDSDIHASSSGVKAKVEMVDSMMELNITENKAEEVDMKSKICKSDEDHKSSRGRAVVPYKLNSKYTEKLMATLASKENALSRTALKALLSRREKLSLQQRSLEDELALCDKHIQSILDGGEDDLALKIQTVIDGCNDVCVQSKSDSQDRTYQHFEDQAAMCMKRKRLSEAILTLQNPCQELDDICYRNNWTLPTYCVSPSIGGFLANVSVKGMDFELSDGSDLLFVPREARESAATKMIAKLKGSVGKK